MPDLTLPTISQSTEPASTEASCLSLTELYNLTLYKWRYSLEAFGFAADEVRELMFLKWLHLSHRVLP